MRNSQSDLLFSARLKGCSETSCYFNILWEHASSSVCHPHLNLVGLRVDYRVDIWCDFCGRELQLEVLPLIVPVLLVQNAQLWKVLLRFWASLPAVEGDARALEKNALDFVGEVVSWLTNGWRNCWVRRRRRHDWRRGVGVWRRNFLGGWGQVE